MEFPDSEFYDLFLSQLDKHKQKLDSWWQDQLSLHAFQPFYSSFDIRHSHSKLAPVDANVFPAGFNNISPKDKPHLVSLIKSYIDTHFPKVRKILLLVEEHTKNKYYWKNIKALKSFIESAGFTVSLCSIRKLEIPSDFNVKVNLLYETSGDLIISNNDFSSACEVDSSHAPCMPPCEMGWYRRRKAGFFSHYNQLACEFAQILDLNPEHFSVSTQVFPDFDISSSDNLKKLQDAVTEFLSQLKGESPYLFLKNNYGTYGLGIVTVHSGAEIQNWNYKKRKDLKATKGGGKVKELILQEGITSNLAFKGGSSEIVLYNIGSTLVGSFFRYHTKKTQEENLNSPGVEYQSLSLSELKLASRFKVLEKINQLCFLSVCKELNSLDLTGYNT